MGSNMEKVKQENRQSAGMFLLNNALYIILLLILATVVIIRPDFARLDNIINIVKQASTKGILALGCAGLIVLAGTDLSIGRVLGLCAAVTASLVQSATYVQRMYPQITEPLNLMIPLLLAITIGVAFGAINGFGVAKLHLHAFIITLGTSLIAWGINSLYIESQPSGTAQALSTFTKDFLNTAAGNWIIGTVRIPKVVLYFLALAVIMHIIWTRTRLGKNMFAVGGNEEAAAVSGVSVTRTIMYVYLIAGALYGIAAYLEAGRIQSVGTNTGINYELDAISACVIGGVSFSGGVGTIPGVVIGAIILQAINYSLVFLSVNPYYQYIIRGLIIIIAVAIDVRKYLAKK
jgi:methyl-galactoside transport system permease protein